MDHFPPDYLDHFLAPIRDSPQAQTALMALLLLIVIDVVLGVAAAAKSHDLQSAKMRAGAWHKVGEMGVVAIADVVDGMLMGGLDIGFSAPVCTAVIIYLCANEVVSCLEKSVKLYPGLKNSPALKLLRVSSEQRDAQAVADAISKAADKKEA
mgnify:CR=1 FL=1